MAVGSYTGDTNDDRNIPAPFQPDYMWVLPQENAHPVARTGAMGGGGT